MRPSPVPPCSQAIDKDVHKNPALEFVGWFTLCRAGGPLREFVSLQRQAINFYNDSAILLTMHPELVTSADATNGRLPISIYESALDVEQPKDDGSMQVDGEEISTLKFRQVPYTIETDETEMIAIDYVAKGAGSAAMVEDAMTEEPTTKPTEPSPQTDKKGKKRADPPTPAVSEPKSTNGVDETTKTLTPEEEDQIASITTRLNSVKMLQSRISLLRSFVQSLPPSYISDQDSSSLTDTSPDPSHLPHLRNIQALLTRLSLLTPVESATSSQHLAAASQAQSNDVALASMLSLLGQDIQALSELGRKFATVESGRGTKGKSGGGPKSGGGAGGVVGSGAGPFGGLDDSDGRFGGVTVTGTGSGMMV